MSEQNLSKESAKPEVTQEEVLARIDRVRARGDRLKDTHVTLAHGAGGKASAALVREVFLSDYGNAHLEEMDDSAILSLSDMAARAGQGLEPGASLAFSTDSYVVNPIRFPGGSIGDLALNGTVNDLAVCGAVPYGISAAFVIEEGLEIEVLRSIVSDMRRDGEKAGVQVVTGDTKVVPKGAADRVFITTAGIGILRPGLNLGASHVRCSDEIIVSGAIGDHGMAVMMARGDLAISAPIETDSKSVAHLTGALLDAVPQTRWMRDATRGGLGTVLNELAHDCKLGVALYENQLVVHDMTRGACDMLGIDPIYVANEGMFCAVVPHGQGDRAVQALRALPGGSEAAVVGKIVSEPASSVVMVTALGGTRMVDTLVGDPLPRIC